MPKDPNIRRVLIIGSGPIVIGQACEFDYSGTQACRALRGEGLEVVLLNSNPATIMTDPEMASATYLEPVTPAIIGKILHYQDTIGKPVDSLLPTLGGQTGLNCAIEAAERGLLRAHNVDMIGATPEVIDRAENRMRFRETARKIGLDLPASGLVRSLSEAQAVLQEVGLPCVLRPAYTLGGTGGGMAHDQEQYYRLIAAGLAASRIHEVLVEESLVGWKEFELELMRDRRDNVIVVCSIENLDPMGVHTGDSITVAPAQTLSDVEYQRMRDSAIALIRAIGVETGGSNVQFAVCPQTGRQMVIELNPRVSRSSALASKATGFPIAKIAAKLAVGYNLDEIPNDITGETLASFEPAIDYVVVKMPRWAFEKFPDADQTLTTQMKSVGEAMAIGRTFKEAFQKCIRSMEVKRHGYGLDRNDLWLNQAADRAAGAVRKSSGASTGPQASRILRGSILSEAPPDTEETSAGQWPPPDEVLRDKLAVPCQGRIYYLRYALKKDWPLKRIQELTGIDPWFLNQFAELVSFESDLWAAGAGAAGHPADGRLLREALCLGYGCDQLAHALGASREEVTELTERASPGSFRLVDTCAGEFAAVTPYCYHTHEAPVRRWRRDQMCEEFVDELRLEPEPHVIILGGGPNRIGQGLEFDYCCVHACLAAREAGYRTIMVNSNPETVSTDYDTSDVLCFEPLTHDDVMRIVRAVGRRAPLAGVIVQFGGQTPLNLASDLQAAGAPIVGTPPESIHQAEDRDCFQGILSELSLRCPPSGIARDLKEASTVAERLGYPVLLRPSYVLGGRGMQLCNNERDLVEYVKEGFDASDRQSRAGWRHPLLVDRFLLDAFEIDVDAVADFRQADDPGGRCVVCGVMEHIEEAGIHSGDSSCVLPPYSLSPAMVEEVTRQSRLLARRLGVCGLMNVQFAIQNDIVFVLETNPRASRTIPFVSKATGVPWAKIATRVMLGESLGEAVKAYGADQSSLPRHTSVKTPVFPFDKFQGVDVVLGPEMRSTGEAMGMDRSFGLAFAKAQMAVGMTLPMRGNALVSVNDPDKPRVVPIARELHELGFDLFATIGTHRVLAEAGIPSVVVYKQDGQNRPFLLDLILDGSLDLLINTPIHTGRASDEGRWRSAAFARKTPLLTTLAGARAAVAAIKAIRTGRWGVRPLQEYVAEGGSK